MSRRWWLIAGLLLICMPAGYGLLAHWRHDSIRACSRECRELSGRGQWSRLAAVAERWTNVEPDRADPWLFRAEAAEGLGDWTHVVQYLDRVPRGDPRTNSALIRKATVEFENLNRPWDGARTCDEVLQSEPRALVAHQQTIFFYAMTLQRAEMVRRIRRAIRIQRESPESYVYLVGASWLYSGSLYRHNTRWLESDPDNEGFQVARALQVYTSRAKSDLEHAAEFEHIPPAEQLLAQYPHNLELVAYFLNRNITEGNLERVRELLQAVPADLADSDARFWRGRAWCEDSSGELESAERSLRKAFELDRYWWQIHFQLHDLLRRVGRREESARFFKIYQVSKSLSTTIMTLLQSVEGLDQQEFCRSMLELAELIEDDEVATALRGRLSTL
jgi:tetratricopeptide (TPR) repeat protein